MSRKLHKVLYLFEALNKEEEQQLRYLIPAFHFLVTIQDIHFILALTYFSVIDYFQDAKCALTLLTDKEIPACLVQDGAGGIEIEHCDVQRCEHTTLPGIC